MEEGKVDRQKVITDTILATQDTIHLPQMWLGLLECWREYGRAEPDDFLDGCQQLREADLWHWANEAGGHGIGALAQAVGIERSPAGRTDEIGGVGAYCPTLPPQSRPIRPYRGGRRQ